MDEEQHPKDGSVPLNFGNALAWRWAPELPRQLTGGFLTLLYALRAMASTDGRLCFKSGDPMTIQQIARACRSDEKDVRDHLRAAIAAGVVAIVDDGHGQGGARGLAVMYALTLPLGTPDWKAAAHVVWLAAQLKKEQRAAKAARKAEREARAAGGSGDSPPTSGETTSGDSPPRSGETTSGDSPPRSGETTSGDSPPTGVGGQSPPTLGGQSPDHPGITHVLPQDMADVGPQPQAARAPEESPTADASAPQPPRLVPTQTSGNRPASARAKDKSAGCQGQRALLLPVSSPPSPPEADEPTDDEIRQAIRALGATSALYRYGRARVAPLLADPSTDTRTGT
ncbi:hypothetical protein [Streptomyces sp. NPDC058084]|uniref:hypothetical protein n=1 Tax=Streptomyces sp. NPDC058084 TaxID=3346333 RepID=UPI0036E19C6A